MIKKLKKAILKNRSRIRDNANNLPIVTVTRSNQNLLAQLLDGATNKVIYTATTYKLSSGTKVEKSTKLGQDFADFLLKKKINKVVFNRNGKIYHGRVQAFAESLKTNKIDI